MSQVPDSEIAKLRAAAEQGDAKSNALLLGALLIFGMLATMMVMTRKVDWYGLGAGGDALVAT